MTAHVTYAGGGLVLPARTPYDRELLRDHVLGRARREERVRITLGGKSWVVERPSTDHVLGCQGCRRQLPDFALHACGTDTTYCVRCALRAD